MKKYTQEYIAQKVLPAVKSSKSYAEVCRKIGVRPGGGNQVYIKSVIEQNGLDTSHFLGTSWAKGTVHKNRDYKYLRDEYSGFRSFLTKAKARSDGSCNLTLEDLKSQWEAQNGKCVYSNVDLNLPTKTYKNRSRIYTASLDRIDSTKDYVKGNIQWISVACNFAKNKMTHEEMLDFCKVIRLS